PTEDQVSLLRGTAVEICHIARCLQTQRLLCGPLHCTTKTVPPGFQKEFLELLCFHGTLRRLQLREPEYVLMAAILVSPDRPGTQRAEVDQLQMALALQSYLKHQRPVPGPARGLGGCPRAGRGEGDLTWE
ncbi:LOW QUALITY PROTEIN: nuclear receptor subfamily 1 group I member 3, partial [Molossus nigricans]